MDLITRTLLLFLISCIAITLQNSQSGKENEQPKTVSNPSAANNPRDRRTLLLKKKIKLAKVAKVGPIRQLFGLFYEQWNDTRYTYSMINDLLNDNFLPENAPSTTTTTPNPNLNISTKAPPYRITRNELAKILRRNLKGIQRLYNLELQDAEKQSRITEREFKRNVSREISKFV